MTDTATYGAANITAPVATIHRRTRIRGGVAGAPMIGDAASSASASRVCARVGATDDVVTTRVTTT
jgi:hypothetical protein